MNIRPQSMYTNGVRHSRQDSPDYLTLNSQIEEARLQSQQLEQRRSTLAEKLARKERRREKKRKKHQRDHPADEPEHGQSILCYGCNSFLH
ncbi:unnamed protein product [Parnassius apollo]|uniref:(apollo) hypothetical protein n=1 Tax=Parnassius apollo TaxID=110799 RepID=A0A8S3XU77_PARAO|nr:unnamed protein product [Parnassius apollo]